MKLDENGQAEIRDIKVHVHVALSDSKKNSYDFLKVWQPYEM